MSFFVFIFDAVFCGTNFFIFEDSMWLVKTSWCVQCCFIRQTYWLGDSCRSEFALWWFFVRKKLSSQFWQFFFLFGLDYQTLFEFSQIWKTVVPFWVWWCLYNLLRVLGKAYLLISLFFMESCLFMCLSVMRFFPLHVFPFLITVTGWHSFFDVLIFVHLINSTSVAIVALANSRWSDFVSIKLSHIGSFHYLLVLATECFFSFDIFEIPRDNFSGC